MQVPDFRSVTVEELARQIREREISAAAVTDAALARIAESNPALNAFVAIDAEAAQGQAAAIDDALESGIDVGPLAGIPIGVKDLEAAAGFVTTMGAMLNRNDPPAEEDSTEVARLRGAGCVVIGKTNTPEYGWIGDTYNPVFGATLNPWNLERSPGGSSGGTSAAIAGGLVPLATGSDGGGSIRIPSALTGLSGIKPSSGRVPSGPSPSGMIDLSTQGPMARKIRDVALALDVVVGPHPGDLRSLPTPIESWREALENPRRPMRILYVPVLDDEAEVDREIDSVVRAAVEKMAATGVEVVESGPVIGDSVLSFGALFFGGMIPSHGPLMDTEQWADVTEGLAKLLEVVSPSVTVAAQAEARKNAQILSMQLAAAMEGFDVMVAPTVAGQTPVSTREGTINGVETPSWVRFTYPFNLTRRPAGTVCAGYTADAMPVGLQVIGHQLGDLGVLEATACFEDLLALDPVAPFAGGAGVAKG